MRPPQGNVGVVTVDGEARKLALPFHRLFIHERAHTQTHTTHLLARL